MAIMKTIKQDNGVLTSYHKISLISIDVNQQVTILVHSYIDADGRQYEKQYEAGVIEGEPVFPYTEGAYFHIPYDEKHLLFTGNVISKAYEWLKTLPEFKGSIDV